MASKEIESITINELIEQGVENGVFMKHERYVRSRGCNPTDGQIRIWGETIRRESKELYIDFTKDLEDLPLVEEQDSSFSPDLKQDATSD